MKIKIPFLLLLILLPVHLYALPEELVIFTDFEDISGEGEFFIGEEPNRVRLIGFTVETLEDPTLLHSGTKAITLGPGQEGRIISEKGIQLIQFYAVESTGGGKIEFRGVKLVTAGVVSGSEPQVVIAENGVVEGLPTDISPGANPTLQSFVSDSNIFLDITDFDFLDGIVEMKVLNVSGKFSLDDLGITLTDRPVNNTIYDTFEGFSRGDGIASPIVLGQSPTTATFTGGFILGGSGGVRTATQSWGINNGESATITFETPAFEVDFYGSTVVTTSTNSPDTSIEVYDTDDNLIATFTNFEADITPEFKSEDCSYIR